MTDNKEGGSAKAASSPDTLHQPSKPMPDTIALFAGDVAQSHDEDHDSEVTLKSVSADMQQFIGRQLRAVFDDVAKQPVPDRFLQLMKQLEGKTSAG